MIVKRTKEFRLGGKSYKLQPRYCNKERCKCHQGHPHGPYWYAYNGKIKYIGKDLPAEIIQTLANIEKLSPTAKEKLAAIEAEISAARKLIFALQDQHSSIRAACYGGSIDNDGREYLASVGLSDMIAP